MGTFAETDINAYGRQMSVTSLEGEIRLLETAVKGSQKLINLCAEKITYMQSQVLLARCQRLSESYVREFIVRNKPWADYYKGLAVKAENQRKQALEGIAFRVECLVIAKKIQAGAKVVMQSRG